MKSNTKSSAALTEAREHFGFTSTASARGNSSAIALKRVENVL
jgi:hypothetical protein